MTLDTRLSDLRKDYVRQELNEEQCPDDPMLLLERWLDEAIKASVAEPSAMILSTVSAEGRPASRVVLCKGIDGGFIQFFSNYHSRKGQHLDLNPYAALNFFWPELERQIRIEGQAIRLPEALSDEYFASRPYTSRIGAWASEQSKPLSSKTALVARASSYAVRYPLQVPRPPYWGGYGLKPDRLEFWQGRPSRLHDRIEYVLQKNTDWDKVRLNP